MDLMVTKEAGSVKSRLRVKAGCLYQKENQEHEAMPCQSAKMKTELCKYWQLGSQCRFGSQCAFAHGVQQLKSRPQESQEYKCKPCNKFYMNGYCQYGVRCKYLHSKEIAHLPEFLNFQRNLHQQKKIENKSIYCCRYFEKLSRLCNSYQQKVAITQLENINFNKLLSQALKSQPLPFFKDLRKSFALNEIDVNQQ